MLNFNNLLLLINQYLTSHAIVIDKCIIQILINSNKIHFLVLSNINNLKKKLNNNNHCPMLYTFHVL